VTHADFYLQDLLSILKQLYMPLRICSFAPLRLYTFAPLYLCASINQTDIVFIKSLYVIRYSLYIPYRCCIIFARFIYCKVWL